MTPEPESFEQFDRPRRASRAGRNFLAALIAILLTFAVGAAGGAAGFVALSNSDSALARAARRALHLNDGSTVAIPTQQTVTLEESSKVIDAAKKVTPSVVSIAGSQQVQDFFGNVSSREVSGGTGFILTSDGLIVTNKHVVSQNLQYKVVLSDGRILAAKVQAVDPLNDLAVVKVEAKDLPTVELGSSAALQVGQFVLAVGNALGEYKNSVSLGVVSGKERQVAAGGAGDATTEQLSGLIQTDASINPGNSGGPLVNTAGQVVGINTAIASAGGGGSVGIGFAIASDGIRNVLDSVRKTGEIVRPYLGIRYRPVDATFQQANGLPVAYGAFVRGGNANELGVLPGSPADKAGVKENDIVTEINGERIDGDNPLANRLQKYSVGDTVTLKVLRGGAEQVLQVKLERAPKP